MFLWKKILKATVSIYTSGSCPPGVISQFVIDRSTLETIFLKQNNKNNDIEIT